jgi:ABC-type antimicrobial peptide transport system permease subunit
VALLVRTRTDPSALAGVGVYGVVAYATARRTREIAVRLALGADRSRIVALVVREGAVWTVAGLLTGVAGASLLSRYLFDVAVQRGPARPVDVHCRHRPARRDRFRRDCDPRNSSRPRGSDACAAHGLAAMIFRPTCWRPPGEVAQLVEHTTENRSVDSSILSLATQSSTK